MTLPATAAPRIEVLSVGDELLAGTTQDTNSSFIARELFALGLGLSRVTLVGDTAADLRQAFAAALDRSRVLIVTGGLGPTVDDRTKEVVAEHLGDELELDPSVLEDIRARFAARGRAMPEINKKQAMLPRGGHAIPNPVGSAPGVHWSRAGREIFLLPGVPAEMQAMLRATVLPQLALLFPAAERRLVTFRTCGIAESELAERLQPLMQQHGDVVWAFYPSWGGVDVKLRGQAPAGGVSRAGVADERWAGLCDGVRRVIGHYLYSESPDVTLAEVVRRLLVARGWTMAVAESCTGGLVAARATEVSGSSAVFTGGFVTYANEAKTAWLGVPEDLLAVHGAVSAPVAAAMARGALDRAGAHVAVGVTGIAGPKGGTPEKPVGLVFLALASPEGCWTRRLHLTQRRDMNRAIASQLALDLVRRHCCGLPVGDPE
jgi:nicotinamide-nucleotide amidase